MGSSITTPMTTSSPRMSGSPFTAVSKRSRHCTGPAFTVVVVSNQSGVGRGLYSEATLAAIHEKMLAAVEAAGGKLARIFYCPHSPDAGCDCRKPLPGMLTRLEEELGLTPLGAPLIGDKESDLELARRVGARPILVRSGYGAETLAAINDPGVECYDDLAGAVKALISVAGE